MLRPTRRDTLIFSTALATAVASAQIARSQPAPRPLSDVQADLRKQIPEIMARTKVPGLSLALARAHEIVWVEAFGLADKEANTPLTSATIFEAASLSKPAYSHAVLKLVELGKFSLDKPIVEYLGSSPNPAEPRFTQITAKHILAHVSGIEGQPREGGHPILNFAPGERFEYSPHGFDLLQRAVEAAVGEKITPMMERMVLKPFGMASAGWGWTDAFASAPGAVRARGYNEKGELKQTFDERIWRVPPDKRAKALEAYPFESVPNAAAGLHATPSDYARFLIEVMRPGKDASHLSPAMQSQMLAPQIRVDKAKHDALFWGLGFGLQHPRTAQESFWHWGDWGNFQHYAVAYPSDGTALVIMTNAIGLPACRDLAPRALHREQPSFAWLMS